MAYKDPAKALEYYRAYNAKRRKPKDIGPRQIAMQNGDTHYFTGKPCVHGHVAKRSVKTRVCMECDRLEKESMRRSQPEQVKRKKRLSYAANSVAARANKKIYRQANKGKIAALNALRKKAVKQRTPKWLSEDDVWIMQEAYILAEIRTRLFGFAWNVDHVIPLRGNKVSGLHVPNNLQVIPALDNIRKKNKFEVGDAN